jgi:DNA-binding transcriptional MerR regulator
MDIIMKGVRRGKGAGYPVRTAARLSGLGIDTLRAWERRYRAVAPRRDDRGRAYTEGDVRRLRLLRDAVARGHAIGRIARLDDRQLTRLGKTDGQLSSAPPDARSIVGQAYDVEPLLALAARFDAAGLDAGLGRAAAVLDPRDLLRDVIGPLRDGGHLTRAAARNLLGAMLRLRAPSTLPGRLLFAATAGESVEIDLLCAALVAARGGLDVIYLGSGVTLEDLLEAATRSEADVVLVGVDDKGEFAADAAAALSRDVELWLVGPGAPRTIESIGSRALDVAQSTLLDAQLARLGARL